MSFRDVNPTQGFGATRTQLDWGAEETYWRENWRSRPYAAGDKDFEHYRPGYRYGFESAHRHRGGDWHEAEGELRTGWEKYEHRGESTWEHMKHAVRDAWDRVTKR